MSFDQGVKLVLENLKIKINQNNYDTFKLKKNNFFWAIGRMSVSRPMCRH